jgi:hypothetical protein
MVIESHRRNHVMFCLLNGQAQRLLLSVYLSIKPIKELETGHRNL